MDRPKLIAIAVAALVVVFLVGFVPQWLRARDLAEELQETRHELQLARLESRLGAAFAETERGNYERARQLVSDFYTELPQAMARTEDPAQRRVLQTALTERDEIITMLARAAPESNQRLMLAYTRYFAAIDPAGREQGTAVTPTR